MWQNMEDVQRSLFEYSHLEYPCDSQTLVPPKSISEYRARTESIRKPGLFDEQPEAREIFISGRGKHHPGTIIRPGQPVTSTPQEDMDIRKKIREVSGLGYSNEIIERIYGQEETPSPEDEKDNEGFALPNIKLQSAKSESILKKKSNKDSPSKAPKTNNSVSWNTLFEEENDEKKKSRLKEMKIKKSKEPNVDEECENNDQKDGIVK